MVCNPLSRLINYSLFIILFSLCLHRSSEHINAISIMDLGGFH
uniref:Uncharacterized protein n=1 Tax=Siphoviridae sp. ctRcp9 TaxID=2825504 RepID=A0A8S5PLK8_9CAUD|nr:MAG TPA: hypothetical protein [Siphoviridae sp. ctRcp9]DAQ24619.1 MAG TPA: hypothetical protein [Caudoviricetes sp.]